MTDDELAFVALTIVGCVVGLIIFLVPTIIAFSRGHHYKWIILAVNVFGSSVFGIGWLVAMIWACWPRETAVAFVVLNDPTTNSSDANRKIYGRYGENIRAVREKSYPVEKTDINFCPHCGKPSQGGAFCASCGRKL